MTAHQIGFFIGGLFACAVLTGLLSWILRDWQQSLKRLVFINLFSFLLASWFNAHGTAVSLTESLVDISTLHAYFWPQAVVLVVGIVIYWGRKTRKAEQEVIEQGAIRKEPTF